MVADMQQFVPGYRLRAAAVRQRPSGDLHRGGGSRRLPPALCREPRHHDGRGGSLVRCWRPRSQPNEARHEHDGFHRRTDHRHRARMARTRSATASRSQRCSRWCVVSMPQVFRSSRSPTETVSAGRPTTTGSRRSMSWISSNARSVPRRGRIAALMLPGLGTMDDIRAASDRGVQIIRSRPLHRGGHRCPALRRCP